MLCKQDETTVIDSQDLSGPRRRPTRRHRQQHSTSRRWLSFASLKGQNNLLTFGERTGINKSINIDDDYLITTPSRLAAINKRGLESIVTSDNHTKQQQLLQQQQVSSMQVTLCNERLQCPNVTENMTTSHLNEKPIRGQHQYSNMTHLAHNNHENRSSRRCLLINKMSPSLSSSLKAVIYSLTVCLFLLNNFPSSPGGHLLVAAGASNRNNSTSSSPSPSQHQHLFETERQFQLLRSANVELNRRSLQRPQREANPTASASTSQAADQPSAAAGSAAAPTCGYPGSPAHASVTFNTTHVVAGTAASYTCDNGYELLGPPRRICQANGTWSPVGIPFCVLNVGLGKAAMQSSTAGHGSAQKAVDGSTSPYYQAATCTMTDVENNPWWYVNLLEPYLVQIVRIDFGTACCANRQKATIAVRVGNNRPDLGNNPLCNRYHGFIEEGKPLFLPCTRPAPGAFVSIHLEAPSGSSLSICETFIYTDHALSIEQCPSFRDQPLGSTATYNGKCYLFHNNQVLNFDGARKYCESRGGSLVDETSPALQGFLSWELYRRHRNDQLMGQYWLGAVRDARNQQNWKWINGKDVQISFWNSLANQGNCSRFDGSKGWLWSDTDCQANLNFICQYRPLSCGKPEKPTNSTLITKNVDNGTVIEYQCAPGNLLMGPRSRACLPTGFFSEFAPKCKYLDCQFPALIPNGDYKLLNGSTSYQSVVNYFCQDGFQMLGKAQLTCDVDERWNGPPPRCEPLLCPAPVAPSNGYVTVTSNITTPGTQATYDCRPGYELVGDRLLTCHQSGSWDNSFPYCREKRQIFPHTLHAQLPGQLPASPQSPLRPPPVGPSVAPATSAKPKLQPANGGSVQFPATASSAFSSNRLASGGAGQPTSGPPIASTASPATPTTSTTTTTSTASLPTASLNGLAGQFGVSGSGQSSPPPPPPPSSGGGSSPAVQPVPVTPIGNEIIVQPPSSQFEEGQPQPPPQQRKPAQSASVSQFVAPELAGAVGSSPMRPSSPTSPSSASWPPPPSRQSSGGSPSSSSSSSQPPPLPQQTSTTPAANQANNNRQNNQKFSFNQQPPAISTSSGSQLGYDSSPLATTNSISVHPTANNQQQQPNLFSSPPSTLTPIQSMATQTTTSSNSQTSHQPHLHQNQNQHLHGGNVLASFSQTPARPSHNALANAKYSLDGIIAVAIFGGFIFLGAIITILVIIIRRRKSSQSSTIDAQTISTYDSNGEHNGLYRNYQQAWENLRFAGPNGQPKSSGNGPGSGGGGAQGGPNGVSLITAHVSGGPSIGLKNYASPAALLHGHPAGPGNMHAHHLHLHGHHNLGMTSSGSSSSQSSSSLGGSGQAGSGGADPLLGHRHLQSISHQHQHHHHLGDDDDDQVDIVNHHHHMRDDDDDDDDDEQGVISADEVANYLPERRSNNHHNHHHHHRLSVMQPAGEGFRDSNELTINADTALMTNLQDASGGLQQQQQQSGEQTNRRRLYSTNSIGRSMASAVVNRRSMGNLSSSGHNHLHHAHQQHHVHPSTASGGGQHQRLVSSSTSSTSTHSSRASPPSDDHSLDQLAYGNNWQAADQTSATAANNNSGAKQQAAGGGVARANLRYS